VSGRAAGYAVGMTFGMTSNEGPTDTEPDPAITAGTGAEQVGTRSELLPEEAAVGSDDPAAQAAVILYESELRTQDQEAAPDTMLDHRTSEEATGE
jgi:hypothetical protein